jgi:Tfp pilus assembly protein PilN
MSINLLPWRETLRKRNHNRDKLSIASAALLLILAIAMWQWRQQVSLEIQRYQIIALQAELQKLTAPYAAAVKAQTEQKRRAQLKKTLQIQHDLNQHTLDIIDSFVASMPANAYLKQIALKDNQVLFKGQVASHRELIQFLRSLEQEQGIRATVVETTQGTDEQGGSDFLITYDITS